MRNDAPLFRTHTIESARFSGRRIGLQSVRLETRSVGLSSRKCVIARYASSGRPASAWLAAMTQTTIRKLGNFRKAFSAQEDAASTRSPVARPGFFRLP